MNKNQIFHDLGNILSGFFKSIGHDVEISIIHNVATTGEAAIEKVAETVKETFPAIDATGITIEVREWALSEWKKHCDAWELVTPSIEWIVTMWNQRKG